MKRFLVLCVISIAAVAAAAQQLFTYKDKSGSLTVRARSGLVEQTSANKVHLVLKGTPVVLNSLTDGVQIEAPSVVCDANSGKQTKIGKAVATSGVHTIKR